MKYPLVTKALIAAGLLAITGSFALAQTTVYSDNFAADSSLSSTYLNMNSISGTANEYAFTADTQLQLTSAAASKNDELLNTFTPVTLSSGGQYISFSVNFNSTGLVNGLGQAGNAGDLLIALANSGGTPLGGGGLPESESSSANTGSTHGDVSYAGMFSLNTTPKTASKFFVKTASGLNGVAYSSDSTPNTSVLSPGNPYAFSGSDDYTLTYTLTYVSSTDMTISDTLVDDSSSTTISADDFSVDTTSVTTPTDVLDTFDFGFYTGSESAGYDLNITDLSVVTTGTIPEPSILALGGAGLGLLSLIRRRRRS